ncbi:MAG: hypothetical protein AB1627_01150 [Chloroflexota bacterium]
MGDVVFLARRTGRGRQPAEVEAVRDARDELTALIDEGRVLGALIVALARRAQVSLARGQSPATTLDELERAGLRQLARMTAAGVEARREALCPDGEVTRHAGHGAAA